MNSIETVEITIFNRAFSLKTPTDKAEMLRRSAQYLNDKMKEISKCTGKNDFEALAVASALNIIAEFQQYPSLPSPSLPLPALLACAAQSTEVPISKQHPVSVSQSLAENVATAEDSTIIERMLHKIRLALATQ